MTVEFIVHTIPGSPFAPAVMATLEEARPSFQATVWETVAELAKAA